MCLDDGRTDDVSCELSCDSCPVSIIDGIVHYVPLPYIGHFQELIYALYFKQEGGWCIFVLFVCVVVDFVNINPQVAE